MATRPELPESIVISQFTGVKNVVDRERLAPGELSVGLNVDIDDAGQIRLRRGRTQVAQGDFHSLYQNGDRTYAVKDGILGSLNTQYEHTPITEVGKKPLAYAAMGDITLYASEHFNGKILGDGTRVDWGAQDGDQWLSPVVRPTETLGEIRGKLVGAPPVATAITTWNGRVYLANGKVLWATELYMIDYVDRTRNFMQFEHDITALAALDGGIYVGTAGGLYFLTGTLAAMQRKDISSTAIVPGSCTVVPRDRITIPGQGPQPVEDALMMLSRDGILACMDGGQVYNLTRASMVFPDAEIAAALYREDSGVSSYLAVTGTSGDKVANSRVGDYCDAEIRRFQGG